MKKQINKQGTVVTIEASEYEQYCTRSNVKCRQSAYELSNLINLRPTMFESVK